MEMEFTTEESVRMHQILKDIRSDLKTRVEQVGENEVSMYELCWLMSIEELLGRIETRNILSNE